MKEMLQPAFSCLIAIGFFGAVMGAMNIVPDIAICVADAVVGVVGTVWCIAGDD